jgi:aldose 1-epimerase
VEVTVTYTLSQAGELALEYRAETDRATPINLTNHAYWNLAGVGSGSVLEHELELACSLYLPADENLIPTGEVRSVKGTPLDFTRSKRIGADIGKMRGGYDHCFVASKPPGELAAIARLYEPGTGRGMEILTTKPAVQLYTGNFLDGTQSSRGVVLNRHGALCLETEFFPDAVNHAGFPSAVLRPGEIYLHRTIHRFFVE